MPSARAQDAAFFQMSSSLHSVALLLDGDGYMGMDVTSTNASTSAIFTVQTSSSLLNTNPWVDYIQIQMTLTNGVTKHRYHLLDFHPPAGMAFIPAGSFTMGDSLDGLSAALPLRYVFISAFYMDKYEVTKALWDNVYAWAITQGYEFDSFDGGPQGKANNHPVQLVSWYDCLKWCNARSEREGRTPAYYTDEGLTVRFRTGPGSGQVFVNWSNGYRLPTEAEWEKAARGGPGGLRFPAGDRLSQSQANFYAYPLGAGGWSYDDNIVQGYHPTFNDGTPPYTSPVGYFAPNGYGLYDMIGNVWEWCWDAFSATSYNSSPGTDPIDPRGPDDAYPGSYPGSYPVIRGGAWGENVYNTRTARRNQAGPTSGSIGIGFRSVLPPNQP